jgi:hypothetical protein
MARTDYQKTRAHGIGGVFEQVKQQLIDLFNVDFNANLIGSQFVININLIASC